MHTSQRLPLHEPLESFHAQGKLTQSQRPLCAETSGAQSFEMLRCCVWSYAEGCRKRWADGKTQRVENLLPHCVGGLMLVARTIRIRQEEIERRKAQWEREERERAEFVRLMQELEEWIKGWNRWLRLSVLIDRQIDPQKGAAVSSR